MFHLSVFRRGQAHPVETESVAKASDVLEAIPRLLQAHADCTHIEVFGGATRLFAVDCRGRRLDDG